jgi:hypothetical protein
MPLVGDGQGAGHAGDAAAHHQGGLVHRQIDFFAAAPNGPPGHGHARDVLGLVRGFFRLLGVDPGAVLADVGHLAEILIDAGFSEGVPEQGLQGPGEQAAMTTRLSPFSLTMSVISLAELVAQEKSCSWAYTTWGRVKAYSTVDGTSTTLPILAPQWHTKTPILGSSRRTRPFHRGIGSVPGGQLPPPVVQEFAALGAGAAGVKTDSGYPWAPGRRR